MLENACTHADGPHAGYLDVEYEALVALYHATGGDDWIDNTGWITNTTHLSGWYGVTMNGSAVMELDLSNNNLKGNQGLVFVAGGVSAF